MANSTTTRKRTKPAKDFPLFKHATGRWAKKCRGKFAYFGKVADDPKGERAIALWLEQKDDLLAGRKPGRKQEGTTVADLCDAFIVAKEQQRDTGEITPRTWADYKATTDRLVNQFGKNTLVASLTAQDFESLRATVANGNGPVTVGNFITRVRVCFKYGYDAGLLDRPVRFGPMFKRPSKKVLRLARAAKGPRLLEPAELKKLIDAADAQLSAMILLALNCGFGNSDCGTLPLSALDLDGGWVNYHRPKTGIDRRCPLWPETVAALRKVLAKRPKAKGGSARGLMFVTRTGASWSKDTTDNPITKEFRKLLDDLELYRPGLGFYSLRHIFRTMADEARDQPAANAIMGHADGSMAAVYRERIADERLRAVADYVRAWLYPPEPKKPAAKRKGKG